MFKLTDSIKMHPFAATCNLRLPLVIESEFVNLYWKFSVPFSRTKFAIVTYLREPSLIQNRASSVFFINPSYSLRLQN